MYVPTWVHISVWFWFRFWIRTSIKNEPKTYEKLMKMASTVPYNRVHIVRKCWFDFWYVFGSFSMLVRLQKPNQNQTKTKPKYTNLWYGFGMVSVWFKPEPKPNGYIYPRTHNNILLYAIFFKIEIQTEIILSESETAVWYRLITWKLDLV